MIKTVVNGVEVTGYTDEERKKMTDDKVKAREFRLYIHGEPHKGYLTIDPLFDMKPPYKAGTESVDLIEKSSYLALQSELEAVKKNLSDMDGIYKGLGEACEALQKERDELLQLIKNKMAGSCRQMLEEVTKERDGLRSGIELALAKLEVPGTDNSFYDKNDFVGSIVLELRKTLEVK